MKKISSLLLVTCLFLGNAYAQSSKPHDTKEPIEITSDQLEVLKKSQKAIFTGEVEAKQGDLNIKADKMLVFYSSKKDKIGKTQNSIAKVETKGNVRLKTAKEMAESDSGIFNVDENIITLSGRVVLTSGKNVVKGEQLVYDLTTGQSKIVSQKQRIKGKKERVRGVFTPNG